MNNNEMKAKALETIKQALVGVYTVWYGTEFYDSGKQEANHYAKAYINIGLLNREEVYNLNKELKVKYGITD